MKLLRVLLIVIALCMGFVVTRPGTYHVQRSAMIAASPGAIYPKIADFHQWETWSPWEKLDPKMKNRMLDFAASAVAGSCDQCFQMLEAARPIPDIAH